MEKASKALRRSGVRIKSIGSGHSDLQMVISQLKDVRQDTEDVSYDLRFFVSRCFPFPSVMEEKRANENHFREEKQYI
jgi:hypothetical protein